MSVLFSTRGELPGESYEYEASDMIGVARNEAGLRALGCENIRTLVCDYWRGHVDRNGVWRSDYWSGWAPLEMQRGG